MAGALRDAIRGVTGGMDPEHGLFARMGLEIEPISGGCGLAGRADGPR